MISRSLIHIDSIPIHRYDKLSQALHDQHPALVVGFKIRALVDLGADVHSSVELFSVPRMVNDLSAGARGKLAQSLGDVAIDAAGRHVAWFGRASVRYVDLCTAAADCTSVM